MLQHFSFLGLTVCVLERYEDLKEEDHLVNLCVNEVALCRHCESGEWLWLQGEAAFEIHSFRDAEPQPVIPLNEKKNGEMS